LTEKIVSLIKKSYCYENLMKVFFNLLLTCLLIKNNVLTFVILIKNYDIIILILFLSQVNYCHQFKSVNGPDVGIRMKMILFNFSAN
jgi:hypothetical protein